MACEEENVLLQEKLDAAAKEDTQVFVKFRKNQNFPGPAFAPLKHCSHMEWGPKVFKMGTSF